jgi:hypothetical protein
MAEEVDYKQYKEEDKQGDTESEKPIKGIFSLKSKN